MPPTFVDHPDGKHYLMVSRMGRLWEWGVAKAPRRDGRKWLAYGVSKSREDALRLGKMVLEHVASRPTTPDARE
jgi:hypothetical protein